jgi:ABC-2 type transport system ATP-binding protein
MSGPDAVVVEDLRMSYGDLEVLHGVDLRIGPGEVVAVLGPNGAGKTTAVEILEGFRDRSGGSVRVLGVDPRHGDRDWRARLGVVLQTSQTETELTARERLRLYAGYHPRPRDVDEILRLIGLSDQAYVRCGRLSGGQLRRLDVGLALVGDPELLVLDEPTTGFDPVARLAAWDLIDDLAAAGMTIVLTTHQLDEAERLADRIAVVLSGRVVADGSGADLVREYRHRNTRTVRISATVHNGFPSTLPDPATVDGDQVTWHTDDPLALLVRLDCWAREQSIAVTELQVRQPTLEDAYLALIAEAGPSLPPCGPSPTSSGTTCCASSVTGRAWCSACSSRSSSSSCSPPSSAPAGSAPSPRLSIMYRPSWSSPS